jgi:hypothetical protein
MQMCNTRDSGPVDGRGTALLARAHANERLHSIDFGFRGFAAAVVPLELGFRGRSAVAMA